MLSGNSRRSYSDWGVKPSLALRGIAKGYRSDVVVKLSTPRFTPLLYIRREINSISRFLVINLYKCDTPHLQTRAKRTYRAYTSQLHFSKYFYLGCYDAGSPQLINGGSVCPHLSALSGMSDLIWLAGAPVLVKMRGLAPISAPFIQ
jgi:hypothetical protein